MTDVLRAMGYAAGGIAAMVSFAGILFGIVALCWWVASRLVGEPDWRDTGLTWHFGIGYGLSVFLMSALVIYALIHFHP